jgi:glycerophosphoryl diester phosphodiesterase
VNTNVKRRKVLGGLIAGGFLQGCGGGGSGGAGETPVTTAPAPPILVPTVPAPDTIAVPVGPTLSDFVGQPIYIAHRGNAAMYPEETYLAYDESVRNGHILLEGDVATLGDGSLALMHDGSVDRTTMSSGSLTSFNASSWSALRVDGNAWHGSNYGNNLDVPLFRDWIQRYRTKAIFVPEDKDGRSMAAMIEVFNQLKLNRDKVLLQCFSAAPLKLALAAGYQACFLNNNASTSIAVVKEFGVGWVGLPMGASADLKKWIDSGLKVLLWTVNRRFQHDEGLAAGVQGFFSDDVTYFKANKPLFNVDQFSSGNWAPGMLGNGSDTSRELRGEFTIGGYWGYRTDKLGYMSCLHGYLCPIRSALESRAFDINLKLTFDTAFANDSTRFASIFLGPDDRPFMDINEWSSGYHIVLRKNGALEIHKKALGMKAQVLRTSSSAPIADGEEIAYRISVTATRISLIRLGRDGSTSADVTVTDSSFHSVYVSLGRNGLACRFRQITVT